MVIIIKKKQIYLHMKVIHLTSNGSAEEKLRLMFRMYDKNGNGSIDAREMNE